MKPNPFFTAALAAGLLALSCAQAPERSVASLKSTLSKDLALGRAAAPLAMESAAPAPPAGAYAERKQVKTGSVTLETGDLEAAEKALTEKVTALGGFVENAQAQGQYRTLVLRIPAPSFDAVLGGLGSLGRVTGKQVGVTDVTVQFYDLETRLKNQRLLLDQYRTVLAKTVRLEDTLTAMEKISALTAEIEATEGQFRYLARQVDLSTLTVELTPPLAQGGRDWPDWSAGFSDLVHTLADFGTATVLFLLGALVVGPILLGLVFFAVWLWVGKPGLWRRIKALKR